MNDRLRQVLLATLIAAGCNGRVYVDDPLLPEVDPARIRAFFVHPSHARKGLGSAILRVCEDEILAAGFREATMVATLAGEPLYSRHGYLAGERYEIPLPQGLSLPVVRMGKRLGCPGPKTR